MARSRAELHFVVPVLLAAGLVAAAKAIGARRAAPYTTPGVARDQERPDRLDSEEPTLRVPYMPGSIVLDGDTDDPGWTRWPGPARTHDFIAPSGAPARPFSEVRAVWGDGQLYLCLYAADDDIESRTDAADGLLWVGDEFRMTFWRSDLEYVIDVSPRALVTDAIRRGGGAPDFSWDSGAHASRELDGTLNEPKDTDEEWVIEMAVPLASIGMKGERGEEIGFSVRRCDTPKTEERSCGGWGEGAARGRISLM